MRKCLYIASLITISLWLIGCQHEEVHPTTLAEEVEHQVRPYIVFGSKVSVVVGIVQDGEEAVFAFGQKDFQEGEVPDRYTVYEIGSITKTFTGTLLSQMHLDRQVALSDTIEQYLPSMKVPTYQGQSITLESLATHTSSLPRLPSNLEEFEGELDNPYKHYTLEALYSFLNTYDLPRSVGSEYEYSNVGVDLLGHLLGRADQSSYESAVTQKIIAPLGLRNTTLSLSEAQSANMAQPYKGKNTVSYWDASEATQGAGAIVADMNDMLRYLKINMGLLPSPLYEAMRLAQAPRFAINERLSVGLNWFTIYEGEREIIFHNGATGGFDAFIGFDKDAQCGVVVLTNSFLIGGSTTELGMDLLEVIINKY